MARHLSDHAKQTHGNGWIADQHLSEELNINMGLNKLQ